MAKHIFISYSHKDSDIAECIVHQIIAAGYTVWQDVYGIQPFDRWEYEIKNGVDEAAAVIVVWSANSGDSMWVKKERAMALEKNILMTAIQIDKTPLPPDLEGIQTVAHRNNLIEQVEVVIAALRTFVPNSLLRQYDTVLPFDAKKALVQQTEINRLTKASGNVDLVCVPYVSSNRFCKTFLIGEPTAVISAPMMMQVILQCQKPAGEHIVFDVYKHIIDHKLPFAGLWITGPVANNKSPFDDSASFTVDRGNPEQWYDIVGITEAAFKRAKRDFGITRFQFFFAGPAALLLGVGNTLRKFWTIDTYHREKDGYFHVINIFPE